MGRPAIKLLGGGGEASTSLRSTNLLEFIEDVTEAIDRGDEVDIIFLDFCKAFGKVPRQRLLQKIKRLRNSRENLSVD